jgi:hypothetical protein
MLTDDFIEHDTGAYGSLYGAAGGHNGASGDTY